MRQRPLFEDISGDATRGLDRPILTSVGLLAEASVTRGGQSWVLDPSSGSALRWGWLRVLALPATTAGASPTATANLTVSLGTTYSGGGSATYTWSHWASYHPRQVELYVSDETTNSAVASDVEPA